MSAAKALRPLPRRVLNLVLLLLGVYVALCVAVYVLQDRFIWIPSRAIVASPDQYGLAHRELELSTADGVRLHGWLVEGPGDADEEPRGAVLVCHGNAGNVSNCIGLAEGFRAMGFAVLLFDYRGYGLSTGSPDEHGTYLDAAAAWAHLVEVEGFAPEDVVIFGQSLGGAVATHLARQVHAGAVIVENAFTSAPALGAEVYRILPVRLLMRTHYPTLENLEAIDAPKLVIYTREDEIVPAAHGEALFAAAREPKQQLVTAGGHNDGGFLQRAEWREAVRLFLAQALK